MRIGVFFHDYQPMHEDKDPGQIVLGFNDIGVKAELVTLEKPSLKNYSNIPIRQISVSQAHDENFWASTKYDIVIAYTWLRNDFLWIPEVLKKAGKKVVAKGDTDGRLAFPLHPRWDCFAGNPLGVLPMMKIARRRVLRQLGGEKHVAVLSRHLHMVDFAVVETPQAFSNLAYILNYWNQLELLGKIKIIPNPVNPVVLNSEIRQKTNQVIAIGNWEMKFGDYLVKNTKVMCRVVDRFLSRNPQYQAVIVGQGKNLLEELFLGTSHSIRNRINLTGKIPHADVVKHLGGSNILFVPSISEGLGIATGEAVCMGCSIVGSPLESLHYLTLGGFCGTLAPTFDEDAYHGAMNADAVRWERGEYSPERNASFWRAELDRKEIARKYLRSLNVLMDCPHAKKEYIESL